MKLTSAKKIEETICLCMDQFDFGNCVFLPFFSFISTILLNLVGASCTLYTSHDVPILLCVRVFLFSYCDSVGDK